MTSDQVADLKVGDLLKRPGHTQLVMVIGVPTPKFIEHKLIEATKDRKTTGQWWSVGHVAMMNSQYELFSTESD